MPKMDNYEMMEDEDHMEPHPDMAEKGKGKEMDGETALLPKSFFEGKDTKPGDQFYVEVVRNYENEVEVRYGKEEMKEKPTAEADEALEGMAKENPGNPGMMGMGY
jgi:hypothetical protein